MEGENELLGVFQSTLFSLKMQQNANSALKREERVTIVPKTVFSSGV